MRQIALPRVIALLAGIMLAPIAARAGCGPGEQPTYQDIRYFEIKRFALVDRDHPRFTATFNERYSAIKRSETVVATLESGQRRPIVGNFSLSDPSALVAIQNVLEARHFFDLRFTPSRTFYLDGPEDTIEVKRCGVSTKVGYIVDSFIERNAQWDALASLLDDLQQAIYTMKWERTNTLTNSQPASRRCANSQHVTGDIIPTHLGDAVIVRISKLVGSNGVVQGWRFATSNGLTFVQVNQGLSSSDQRVLKIPLGPSDLLSPLVPIAHNPWKDVSVVPCRASELLNAKYVRFNPEALPSTRPQ